jgi:ribosomal protein L11 methyltransferase
VFIIGRSWLVLSPEERVSAEYRLPLVIDRGAFGSGEHETTVSCLEELEGLDGVEGTRVLDLGCGTGILALAASKMGASSVVAVDIDRGAVETCRENARLNAAGIEIVQGSIDAVRGRFNLIMANIHGDVLIQLAPLIVERLVSGGYALLSGVAFHENYQVLLTFSELGAQLVKNRFMEEYTTLIMSMEG